MVRAHFTLPTNVSLEYQEDNVGDYLQLVDVFGPESGFPLGDVTTPFRLTVSEYGLYTVFVQFKQVSDGSVVGTKEFNVSVVDQ